MSIERYIIEKKEVEEVFTLFSKLFGVRIIFFDRNNEHVKEIDVAGDSPYCRTMRKKKLFNEKCILSDKENLKIASKKKIHIYKCHASLTEGIIPLYNNKQYLGAIMFGQILEEKDKPSSSYNKLLIRLPCYSKEYIENIANLILRTGHYLLVNEFIKLKQDGWQEKMFSYIEKNIDKKIKTKDIADFLGRSVSFLTHNCWNTLGVSPMKCVLKMKMEEAKTLLENNNAKIKEVALKTGYYDEFHFSKVFKSYTGVSPSHWRKGR